MAIKAPPALFTANSTAASERPAPQLVRCPPSLLCIFPTLQSPLPHPTSIEHTFIIYVVCVLACLHSQDITRTAFQVPVVAKPSSEVVVALEESIQARCCDLYVYISLVLCEELDSRGNVMWFCWMLTENRTTPYE